MPKIFCPQCKDEKEIVTDGMYARVLECNHVLTGAPVTEIVKQGASVVEAKGISESLNRIQTLPKIDHDELINRSTRGMIESYEEFFNSESIVIEDLIKEHGKDNALLMMIAIHAHLGKTLFVMNRFRNFYYENIKKMQKEVEDRAVKELISSHDFHYTPADKKPKKINTKMSKSGDEMNQAREGLTKLGVNPADLMKVMGNLMWKKTDSDVEKDDYKAGLKKIQDSIGGKDK